MSKRQSSYLPTIGLEVHAQLNTKSKMFSAEPSAYGQLPNTCTSPTSLGLPGALPSLNRVAIEYAIKMGLACHATIQRYNYFARKNYFYADLPKGYQITQDHTPICVGGKLAISLSTGATKEIRLQRIHLEEDTGKSIHDLLPDQTLLDFNRAGTPLIEIVTKPDLASSEEAYQCLALIRRLVRYLDICDGNMEEGSLRCDANVSVRKLGEEKLGERVEIKNMNSLAHVKQAIAYEVDRQIALLEKGQLIKRETRSYNAEKGLTVHLRAKENAQEYRYFPEPDLSPLVIEEAWVKQIEASMPPLPQWLLEKFTSVYGLSSYDACVLVEEKEMALLYEQLCAHTTHYKVAANWLLGPVKAYLNTYKVKLSEWPLSVPVLAELVDLIAAKEVLFSTAVERLWPKLLEASHASATQLAQSMGLLAKSSQAELQGWVDQLLADHPREVEAYKQGKKGLLSFFIGQLMRISERKADPTAARELLELALQKS